ncbi:MULTISPECIES: transketolase [unclassified Actinomyces]|uniref:transketolase n=1 Tax=unclassified Actinomyces TaxID=2609248 RepID=UPI00201736BF|nr:MULTISPECIES: transketolase [unclassified Actinomyces]MCL3777182.1 transketolase [Actinomyces sp. AC-20-1]MCL3788994.1 transketolase [Actinomyces sp. 187325]MCL3791349.1 transketolase [Actinomyces sp. 186855]MCL3793940.1 transketolase [Actinomyces sp. 217892]
MSTEPFALTDDDLTAINVSKALAADAVEKAGSGHPGTPISLAGVAYLLYQYEMKGDPADDRWLGRDRFVLSAGHASMLQYAQLALAGYGLEIEDLAALRTAGSLTPGHPEYGHTKGVETTTGPLGAGFSNAVGLAMAARFEHGLLDPAAPAGESVFDHYVYTVLGDGCMQEGVTSEAASLAGTQELGNLIAIYDDNDISIEGNTDIAFGEDPSARFEAYGWQVLDVDWTNGGTGYAEDYTALHEALVAARAETTRPSLIRLRTVIAWPSPTKQGTEGSHGAKLGAEEVAGLKEVLGLDPEASFQTAGILGYTREHAAARARAAREDWDARFEEWKAANPQGAALLARLQAQELPEGLDEALPTWEVGASVATRAASGKVLSAIGAVMPELWGGSADLAGSNNTSIAGAGSFLPASLAQKEGDGPYGRVLHFGIREHAMGGILNGIALDRLTRAYGGTFMVFSDYMRPAVRLAALMGLDTTFVWTHDSIGVGEDGPTHQPVEHLAALRAIPGLDVVRPGDANEAAAAWRTILSRRSRPAGIVLSRQNLPVTASAQAAAAGVAKGAYTLLEATDCHDEVTTPVVVLIATGSEVGVAAAAREVLQEAGTPTRVVSAPCLEWFAEQDEAYRAEVLPADAVKVSVEAGIAMGWREIVGASGAVVSLDHFGASAAGTLLFEEYGFTGENVAAVAKEALAQL